MKFSKNPASPLAAMLFAVPALPNWEYRGDVLDTDGKPLVALRFR